MRGQNEALEFSVDDQIEQKQEVGGIDGGEEKQILIGCIAFALGRNSCSMLNKSLAQIHQLPSFRKSTHSHLEKIKNCRKFVL